MYTLLAYIYISTLACSTRHVPCMDLSNNTEHTQELVKPYVMLTKKPMGMA